MKELFLLLGSLILLFISKYINESINFASYDLVLLFFLIDSAVLVTTVMILLSSVRTIAKNERMKVTTSYLLDLVNAYEIVNAKKRYEKIYGKIEDESFLEKFKDSEKYVELDPKTFEYVSKIDDGLLYSCYTVNENQNLIKKLVYISEDKNYMKTKFYREYLKYKKERDLND